MSGVLHRPAAARRRPRTPQSAARRRRAASLAIPDQLLRQAAEEPEAASAAPDQVDRDLPRVLPDVELQKLPGAVAGALIGARRQIERPHLAQVVVEDRPRAPIAILLERLPQPLARQARIIPQQPVISALCGSSFEPRGPQR